MLAKANAALATMDSAAKGIKTRFADVGAAMHTVGMIGLGVFVGIVGFFGMAENAAMQYQTALTNVQVTAHLSEDQTTALGHALELAAIGTRASATDMATALGPVSGELARVQGGALSAADATKLMVAAQDLAESSDAQLGSSTKNLVNLLLTYHLKAKDAASVSDSLFQAHSQLGISTDQLASTLASLQPRIAGSGLSLQNLLGIVREITPTVGSGSRAMLQVGTVLQQLQTPAKSAADELAKLHIQITNKSGAFIGYGAEIDKIRVAYDKLSSQSAKAALLTDIFGHSANIGKVLIEGGSAAITASTTALTANGTAASAAALKMQDTESQMSMLPKTIGDIALPIGMVLLPALNRLLLAITPILTGIATWTTNNPQLATAILGVVAALAGLTGLTVVLGPALGVIGAIAGSAVAPFVLAGVAVGALIYFLMQIPAVANPVKDAIKGLLSDVQSLIAPVENVGQALFGLFSGGKSGAQAATAVDTLTTAHKSVQVAFAATKKANQELVKAEDLIKGKHHLTAVQLAVVHKAQLDAAISADKMRAAQVGAHAATAAHNTVSPGAKMRTPFSPIQDALGTLGTKLQTVLLDLQTKVGKALSSIALAAIPIIRGLVNGIVNTFVGLLPQISTWIDSFYTTLYDGLTYIVVTALPIVGGLITGIGDAIISALPTLGRILLGVGNLFVNLMSTMADIIARDTPKIVAAVLALGQHIIDWILNTGVPKVATAAGGFIDALAKWLPGAAQKLISKIPELIGAVSSIVGMLIAFVIKNGPVIAQHVLSWGEAFVGWVMKRLPSLLKSLEQFAGSILAWVIKQAPLFLKQVAGWANAFISWAAKMWPQALQFLSKFLLGLIGWVSQTVPKIYDAGLSWLAAILGWVRKMLPGALSALGKVLNGIIDWILNTGVPLLATAAGQLFDTIAAALPTVLSDLISMVGGILGALVQYLPGIIADTLGILGDLASAINEFIVEQAPKLVAKLISWGLAFVGWIAGRIGPLLSSLGDLLGKLVGWIVNTALPKLLTQLGQWAGAFLGWIGGVVSALPGKLMDRIAAIGGWLIADGPAIGS